MKRKIFSLIISVILIFNSVISVNACENNWKIGEEIPLPEIPTNVKLFTDYRCYNISGTPQSRLQSGSRTDFIGCRRYENDYCVAVGSFYTNKIGDRFSVTLDSGNSFTIIVADQKSDKDTDEKNMYSPCVNYDGENAANVLEFIIDKNAVSKKMYAYGSLDYYGFFKGNIESMTYLGRDNSGDWDSYSEV